MGVGITVGVINPDSFEEFDALIKEGVEETFKELDNLRLRFYVKEVVEEKIYEAKYKKVNIIYDFPYRIKVREEGKKEIEEKIIKQSTTLEFIYYHAIQLSNKERDVVCVLGNRKQFNNFFYIFSNTLKRNDFIKTILFNLNSIKNCFDGELIYFSARNIADFHVNSAGIFGRTLQYSKEFSEYVEEKGGILTSLRIRLPEGYLSVISTRGRIYIFNNNFKDNIETNIYNLLKKLDMCDGIIWD